MVAKRRRVVTAAIAATAANGSGQGVSGVKPGTPSGVYGYFEASFSG